MIYSIIEFLPFLFVPFVNGNDINIAFWIDPVQKDINGDINLALKEIEAMHIEGKIKDFIVVVDYNDDDDDANQKVMQSFCEILSVSGVSIVLDFTYEPWEQGLDYVQAHGIPYMRVDHMLKPFLQMFVAFMKQKDATEVVIVVQNEQDKREVIQQMVQGFPIRTLVLNAGDSNKTDVVKIIRNLRPSPGYYAIFAKGSNMNTIFEKILNGNVFARPAEWHFVFLDTRDRVFKFKKQVEYANKFTVNPKAICRSLQMKDAYCQSGFTFQRALLLEIFRALIDINQNNHGILEPIKRDCSNASADSELNNDAMQDDFNILDYFKLTNFMTFDTTGTLNKFDDDRDLIPPLTYMVNVSINFYSNEHEAATDLAVWQNGELKKLNETISPAKRFFRIGTAEAIPWSYYRKNPYTDELLLDSYGQPIWEGFCIDMIQTLSEKMNFDYEIVAPTSGKFGRRDPVTNEWDGLVGDLVRGETDFVVAAFKMYSEREEYIDFLAPYFEQTGITIVMRKPVKKTSLFKFMTVLRFEVWMSIVGALVSTAIVIWLLDTYSPYSARNNKKAYPYPCSVWDYPIKEQYGRILIAINSSMPVKDAEEGFRKVNERENADYAFIHDSSEIKYEITRNCNLTEVGEVFAEQPYAVAVQQGSHLGDPISFAILELQKDRYFEELKAKYWNRSKANCPLSEEEQGITLESLGGVFIATFCGLGLAMIALVIEVFYNKRKFKASNIRQVKPVESIEPPEDVWHSQQDIEQKTTPPPLYEAPVFRGRKIPSGITMGSEFKPGLLNARRRLSMTRNDDFPEQSELPGYVE
ncbi:ionotropic receptor 8a isoform X2 [Haematobia irritans]|uniref:ionotropic receptor 8a isoform X2 n=1 Tax=Haematobia irritans TaxID=7368 RepID=UPI003F4FEDE6